MTCYYSPAEEAYVEYMRKKREAEEVARREKAAKMSAKVIPTRA